MVLTGGLFDSSDCGMNSGELKSVSVFAPISFLRLIKLDHVGTLPNNSIVPYSAPARG
jgi:hypothetical protein